MPKGAIIFDVRIPDIHSPVDALASQLIGQCDIKRRNLGRGPTLGHELEPVTGFDFLIIFQVYMGRQHIPGGRIDELE